MWSLIITTAVIGIAVGLNDGRYPQELISATRKLVAPVRPLHHKSPPPANCGAAPSVCVKSRYRSLDGSCNNLVNPELGVANSRYSRLLPAKYGDDISSPTVSSTGRALPSARLVSVVAFGEANVTDPQFTLANMQWGQIITHDMSLLIASSQSQCCTNDGKFIQSGVDKTCYPISVPQNDPDYSASKIECLNFVRTMTDKDANCSGSYHSRQAEKLSEVTAFMDLSLVYGNSETQNGPLRLNHGGRMLTEKRNGHEWPPRAPNGTIACDLQTASDFCYLAGDDRANQNTGLTTLQIILLREHNRIADELQHLNPHWNDEHTFQEARRINIAQSQHISYYEWLPMFLGKDNMLKNKLIYNTKKGNYVNDYDQSINPSVLISHATAAFRYFHSQIEGRLDLISELRSTVGSLRLSDWLHRAAIIEVDDNFDSLARGLATQPQQLTDINYDPETNHFLFRSVMPLGIDLRATDIQRNRDHGLASYNDFREFCGLPRAHSWEGFLDVISPQVLKNLQSLYASHEDVDVTVAGSLEKHVNGTLSGPVFQCIMHRQFYRTRVGDRFFFENEEKDTRFTRDQLSEIRKSSISRLFCNNGNNIRSIQPSSFLRISDENKVIPCSKIPIVDLSAWKDSTRNHN